MTQTAVSFAQSAAITALKDTSGTVEKMRIEFEKRAEYMAKRLNAIDGVVCHQPTGAFYCFPDVSDHFGRNIGPAVINDSMDFANSLLEQAKVAVVPGLPFGCPKNIRLSFACSLEQIKEGLDRIEKWLKQ